MLYFMKESQLIYAQLITMIDYPGPKYRKRSAHGQSGHAFNLADKLNKMFSTDKFVVYKMTSGVPVSENESEFM